LLKRFEEHKLDYITRSSAAAWDLAFQHARILFQNLELQCISSVADRMDIRDRAMATNIGWILQHEGPGTKMVTWANNGHAATQEKWDGNAPPKEVRF